MTTQAERETVSGGGTPQRNLARLGIAGIAVGAVAWALIVAASVILTLLLDGWQDEAHIRAVMLMFATGALAAFPVASVSASLCTARAPAPTRFAAHLLALAGFTVLFISLLYALRHRAYFAQWHDSAFTIGWAFEFFFTVVGALYQFSIFGLRMLMPIGFPALFAFSVWLAAKAR